MSTTLLICLLLFSLNPFSALAALRFHPSFRRDSDPTGSDQPNDSDDGGDVNNGGKQKGGGIIPSTSSSSTSSSATSNNTIPTSSGFHPVAIVGVIIAMLAVGLIVGLTTRWWMMRRRQKAEEERAAAEVAASTDTAQAQKTWVVISPSNLPSLMDRTLPAVPHDVGENDDFDADATPRASNIALPGPEGARLLRNESARSPTARGTFISVLPDPTSGEGRDQGEARTMGLPRIHTDEDQGRTSTDTYTPTSTHLSLPFSSTLSSSMSPSLLSLIPSADSASTTTFEAKTNGMVYTPDNDRGSRPQWLNRSPMESTRRTSTLLEDLVGYQKQLEGEVKPDPPPKYSVEGP